jgi:hypothetical protein
MMGASCTPPDDETRQQGGDDRAPTDAEMSHRRRSQPATSPERGSWLSVRVELRGTTVSAAARSRLYPIEHCRIRLDARDSSGMLIATRGSLLQRAGPAPCARAPNEVAIAAAAPLGDRIPRIIRPASQTCSCALPAERRRAAVPRAGAARRRGHQTRVGRARLALGPAELTPTVHTIATTIHGRYCVRAAEAPPFGLLVGCHGYGQTAEGFASDLERIPGVDRWLLVSVQGLHDGGVPAAGLPGDSLKSASGRASITPLHPRSYTMV